MCVVWILLCERFFAPDIGIGHLWDASVDRNGAASCDQR